MATEAKERAAAIERANAPRGITEETVPKPRTAEVIEVSDLEEPLEEDPPASPADPRVAAAADGLEADEDPVALGEPPPAAPAAPPPAAPDGPSGLAVAGSQTGKITPTAQALYDQGYSLYHQGRYVDAEETFQRFLSAYGTTDLGDNAQFWIGQCRLGRNELQSALAAFRQTVREHPDGNKVPDALLQAGEVLERLGDADEARATYQDVERRFPGTAASAEAAKRLGRLGA